MSETLGSELTVLDEVHRVLAEAKSVHEVKEVRDKAEALRKYAKDARLGLELQNQAAEAKLRAERKAGEMIAAMQKHPPGPARKDRLHDATDPPMLAELGIEKTQSHRWQRMAAVPAPDFEAYLREAQEVGREITASGLLRLNGRRHEGMPNGRQGRDDSGSCNSREPASSAELLEESCNHCGQLASLLQPACDDPPALLAKAERRQIARLVRELGVYLHALRERELGATPPDSSFRQG